MSKTVGRLVAACTVLTLLVAACAGDDGDESSGDGTAETEGGDTEEIDYEAIGLWDDGPCDESRPPLVIGLMTVFQSPVVSLEDQAIALEAAAEAFNARGGANGACIEVHTCDDGANVDQAVACVREIDEAGVVATVNDQGTAGQAEVSAAMVEAGIPRIASNVTSNDWGDQNAYPLDPSGTGGTFMHPAALLDEGVTEVGLIRVDLPNAAALVGLLGDLYADEGMTFPYDVARPRWHHRLQSVHPRRGGSRRRGRHVEPRGARGGPGAARRGAARHRPALRFGARDVLAQCGRRHGGLLRADGLRQRVPAGDLRPTRVRGAARRSRGLGRGRAATGEHEDEPHAVLDRALRPACE